MIRPEELSRLGPAAAARCSFTMQTLLDPDTVLAVQYEALLNAISRMEEQHILAQQLIEVIDNPEETLYTASSDAEDASTALAQVKSTESSTTRPASTPWAAFQRGHERAVAALANIQTEGILARASADTLKPLLAYCNQDSGRAEDFTVYKTLLGMDWGADIYADLKYIGELSPMNVIRGWLVGKTGPFPLGPGEQYTVTVNGTLSAWSPPVSSFPSAVGTKESITIVPTAGAAMSCAPGDPVSTRLFPPPTVITIFYVGAGVAQLAAGISPSLRVGDWVYVPGGAPGDQWHMISGLSDTYIDSPTLSLAPGLHVVELHQAGSFAVLINGTTYWATVPIGDSVTLDSVRAYLATVLPSSGPDAVTVSANAGVLTIETVAEGPTQSLEWHGTDAGLHPRAYDWLSINADDPAVVGTEDNSEVILSWFGGGVVTNLDYITYTPVALAALLDGLSPDLTATTVNGNLVLRGVDYGDWSFIYSPVNPFGIPEVTWGRSVDLADTAVLDFETLPVDETGMWSGVVSDASVPAVFAGVTEEWVILLRRVGEKRWRAYPIEDITDTHTVLGRDPTLGFPEELEVKARYQPYRVRSQSEDAPGVLTIKHISPGEDLLGLSGTVGSTTTKLAAVTTDIGKSPVRVGDWVTLNKESLPVAGSPSSTWPQPRPVVVDLTLLTFPSGWTPAQPYSDMTFEDFLYLLEQKDQWSVYGKITQVADDHYVTTPIPIASAPSGATGVPKMPGGFWAMGAPIGRTCALLAASVEQMAEYLSAPPSPAIPDAKLKKALADYITTFSMPDDLNSVLLYGKSLPANTAIRQYMEATNLRGMAYPFSIGWLDRFFVVSHAELEIAAATAIPSASYETLYGYDGDDPSPDQPEKLNPNADDVEYDAGDDREYG